MVGRLGDIMFVDYRAGGRVQQALLGIRRNVRINTDFNLAVIAAMMPNTLSRL